jgi:hypothetical protein
LRSFLQHNQSSKGRKIRMCATDWPSFESTAIATVSSSCYFITHDPQKLWSWSSLVCVSLSIFFIRATRQQQHQLRKKKKDSSLAYAWRGHHNVSVHTWTKRIPRCKIHYPHSHFWPKPNSLLGSLKLKTEYQMETRLDWAKIKEQSLFIFDVWKWNWAFMYRVRNR